MPSEGHLPRYCATCDREVPNDEALGMEYDYTSPDRYDGVSEWQHTVCGRREGRWTHKELLHGETEPRYGGGAVLR